MKTRKTKVGFVFASVLLIAGLGMIAGSVAITSQFARVHINLKREGNGKQKGAIKFVIAGIPVFWRSLDGLASVKRREYQVSEEGRRSGPSISKTVGRVDFLDSRDRVITWGERAAILNEREPIARYLASDDPEFSFTEKAHAWTWIRMRDAFFATVFVLMLLFGGTLCTLGGIGGIWNAFARLIRPKQSDCLNAAT